MDGRLEVEPRQADRNLVFNKARPLDPLELGLQMVVSDKQPPGCWKPSPHHLQEQVFFFSEPFLQPLCDYCKDKEKSLSLDELAHTLVSIMPYV